jgi:hypothetical protein
LLLDHGADIQAVDEHTASALHRAALFGHADVVKMLIDRGAGVNARMSGGPTPLKWALEGQVDHASAGVRGGDFPRTIELLRAAGGIE